jgi:uncharacterized SAM-binding protein YcdF (DUF218 family)
MGVAETDILIENQSRNTHENALFSKKIMEEKYSNATCLLLTSAWHLPRAQRCFDKCGLKTTAFPVDFWAKPFQLQPSQVFQPDSDAFQKWDFLIKEWVGLVVYRMKGYN